jgi:membrane protein
MSWIPKDASVVALIVSLTAILGTVVNAVAGLSQFSRTAKAYRTIEWTNSTLDQDQDDEVRQRPLMELRISQEAHLLATHYVPWWRFMVLPLWMILVGSLFLYAIAAGKYSSDATVSTLYYLVFCTWFAWLFIGSYCERVRIVEHHKAGCLTESRIPLWRMGNKVLVYAICFAVAASAFCGAVALAGRPRHSDWLAGGGIAVGMIVLPVLIPVVRLRAREWVKETKGGSSSIGNNRTNVPRFLAKLLDFDVFRDEPAN